MLLDADTTLTHLDRLHAAAVSLCGNRHDADDLVHDVYLSVLRRPRRLTGGSELAYLMTMLRNRFIDQHRSARRRTAGPSLDESLYEPADREGLRPDRVAENNEILACVERVESPFRETLIAVDVCGLSYKEAAAALDVPVGTIMSRLARARTRVVRMVEGELIAA